MLLFLGAIGYYIGSEKLRLGNGLSCVVGIFFFLLPYILLYHFVGFIQTAIVVIALLIIIGVVANNRTKKEWLSKNCPFISPYKLADDLEKAVNTYVEGEQLKKHIKLWRMTCHIIEYRLFQMDRN